MARYNVKGSKLFLVAYTSGSYAALIAGGVSGTSGLFQSNYVESLDFKEAAITSEPAPDWDSVNSGITLTKVNEGKTRTGSVSFHVDATNPYPLDTDTTYSMLLWNPIQSKHMIAEIVTIDDWTMPEKVGESQVTASFNFAIGNGLYHRGSGFPS